MMAALAEGLALADAAGLDADTLLGVLDMGAMANPMFALKGPAMAEGRHPPAFPLKHQLKDLRLSRALAAEVGARAPAAAAAEALYAEAAAAGHGDADFSAVLEALR
jgi:glyoxylate/succinic semialdehyde reductase